MLLNVGHEQNQNIHDLLNEGPNKVGVFLPSPEDRNRNVVSKLFSSGAVHSLPHGA
jgi:hypothetical protein